MPNAPAPKQEVVDDPRAPEIFASGAYGFRVANGVVSITFASARPNHASGSMRVVVVGTIVLPTAAARSLVAKLGEFLSQSELEPKPPGAERLQ